MLSPFGNTGMSGAVADFNSRSLPSLRSLNILPVTPPSSSSLPLPPSSHIHMDAYPSFQDISSRPSPLNQHVRLNVRTATSDVRNTSRTSHWQRDSSEMDFSIDGPRPGSSNSATSSLASMTSSDTSFSSNTASSEHAIIAGTSHPPWSKSTQSYRQAYRSTRSSDNHESVGPFQKNPFSNSHSVGQLPPLLLNARRPTSPFSTSLNPTSTSLLGRATQSTFSSSYDSLPSHIPASQLNPHCAPSRLNVNSSNHLGHQLAQGLHTLPPFSGGPGLAPSSMHASSKGGYPCPSEPQALPHYKRINREAPQDHPSQSASTGRRRNITSADTRPIYDPYYPFEQIHDPFPDVTNTPTSLSSHARSPAISTDPARRPPAFTSTSQSCRSHDQISGLLMPTTHIQTKAPSRSPVLCCFTGPNINSALDAGAEPSSEADNDSKVS